MATFTFLAKITFMLVILFMARVAIHRQLFLEIHLVATFAGSGEMLAYQRIFGFLGMIKQNFLPAFFQVTAFALLA